MMTMFTAMIESENYSTVGALKLSRVKSLELGAWQFRANNSKNLPQCNGYLRFESTAVATGKYDESSTTKSMEYIVQHVSGATLKEFDAAHMINLECPELFNAWLGAYLNTLKMRTAI